MGSSARPTEWTRRQQFSDNRGQYNIIPPRNNRINIYYHSFCHVTEGARERFFSWGGGKNIDMPSDCQNLGGHMHIHPIETKSWGQLPPLPPPPAPAPQRHGHSAAWALSCAHLSYGWKEYTCQVIVQCSVTWCDSSIISIFNQGSV